MVRARVRTGRKRIARALDAARKGQRVVQAGENENLKNSKVWCARRSPVDGQETAHVEELQEDFCKPFFTEGANGWSSRRSKQIRWDSKRENFDVPLAGNPHENIWVDSPLPPLHVVSKTKTLDGTSSRAQTPGVFATEQGRLNLGICRKLCENGVISEAVEALDSIVRRGCHVPKDIFYRILKRCTQNKDLVLGRRIHALIVKDGYEGDAFLATHLIGFYASHRKLEEAMAVFTKVSPPDAYNWAAIIFAYARHGEAAEAAEAIRLYRNVCESSRVKHDNHLYLAVLAACATAKDVIAGKEVHARLVSSSGKPNKFVGAGLVNMYAKCGRLKEARELFDKLPQRNVVIWNAMIAGYAQQGMGREALGLYKSMKQEGLSAPSSVTYVSLLQACANVGVDVLHEGKQLHVRIKDDGLLEDPVVGGSLVNMYAKCGSLEDARRLFDKLADRSVVTWNAMIAGYAQQGMGEEAFSLYTIMQQEGLAPDSVTYACLLQACAAVAALPSGEHLHAEIEKRGMQDSGNVGAALVNMYAKCGSMYNSQRVFDLLSNRSIEAWGALISGYARQGDSQAVFNLVESMRLEGIRPNEVIFLSLLTVCSHVGLVDKGREYFKAMTTEYGMTPTMEHYISMADLLGRAGHLHEALQMTKDMPFPPNDAVWHTLLNACRKWKNVEVGQHAFQGAVDVDENDDAAYVLMHNIYASTSMWDEAKEMQAKRMKLGAWKKPGQSWWTDMGGVVHTFVPGDKKRSESICKG